jgi:hypothetical protein
LINDILTALNDKRLVGGIFFDLEKAFGCVNHDILFAKMEYYGIWGVMHTLIKSYLEDRYQRVKFNNKLSKWDKINIGVPQGSVLGPLLLIYINDLPCVIPRTLSSKNSSIVLFSDDTSVITNEPCQMNLERNLNTVSKIMKKWLNSNVLLFNLDKIYYLQFITKNKSSKKIKTELDNKMIIQTNFVNFLGITVDNTLSWKQHIDTITPKLNKARYINRSYKLYLSHVALKMVHYAFFLFFGETLLIVCIQITEESY